MIGFAAVGIINAVFIQETFKVASSDDTAMMRQKALLDAFGALNRNTIRFPGALVIGPWPVDLPGERPSPAHEEDEDPI